MSIAVASAAASWGQSPAGGSSTKVNPKINDPFKKPDLKGFIKKFESDDREVYTQRHQVVRALKLSKGMAVADIGAGTGLFTRLFADAVGPSGKVFAVDISRDFLTHIAADAKKRGQPQVVVVEGSQASCNLPAESVDVAFLCDVYHHLENHEQALGSIYTALKPNGKFIVIDFDRVEGKSEDFVLKHVRANKEQFCKEIEAAGFRLSPTDDAPRFKDNFFFRFEKSERPARKSPRRRGGPKSVNTPQQG
jgi:ubiquinone/menaquinone biosynthesis C-methylase UbiE